jgi:ABC-type glycerol-3-phosphate transport system substrate-binding protein
MTRFLRFAHILLLVALVGCSSLAPILAPRTPTPAPVLEATSTPQPVPTPTTPTVDQPRILRVWLPPQFDPNTGTPSADLLNQRLNDFQSEHPDLQIEVRIKGANESAEIVNILSTTNNAAPAVMPDLIALSYDQMQSVAAMGFLHPLDGLTDIMQDSDWYVFARELGSVQNTEYGIPFASDAMMTVYRPSVFQTPPADWNSIFNSGTKVVFSISDLKPYFPLSLYLSAKGQFTNEQGVFSLDENVLVRVLSLYQKAYDAGALPLTIKDFQTDAQSLTSYRNGEADVAIVWASSDIGIKSGQYMPVLGLDDVPFSLGDGWVWALAGSNAENQPLAVELASYLAESDYMSKWTQASGYLPTRPRALDGWQDESLKRDLNDVLLASHPIPSSDVVSEFGPLMHGALVRIFNGEQADVVAQSVIEGSK